MLRDLKVIELASVLAGPSVGQFFAELGADVIKVENLRTGGDVTRTWKSSGEQTDDRSAYFSAVNWGKRSLALDLTQPEGREIVYKLARRSDIVIASYKPGDAEKLAMDYATLRRLNPRIIYGQITGYGSDDERVGYDAVIQAEAGFMSMNGEPGGKSLRMPVALIDILASHQLKEGILLSLIRRMQTGEGCYVEVSLIQAAISSLANQATNWLMAGHLPGKEGSSHPNIAPYGDSFTTSDGGEILLAVGNDKQFQDLCSILGLSEIASAPGFINNQARVHNRQQLNELIQDKIKRWPSDELIRLLRLKKIPAGLIYNLRQVFEQKEALPLILEAGAVSGVRNYVGNVDRPLNLTPPPHFGEHTMSIIRSLD